MDIQKICNDIAKKHAEIIEDECKKVCEKYNCQPSDLLIEYYDHTHIKINARGSEFTIENVYNFNNRESL